MLALLTKELIFFNLYLSVFFMTFLSIFRQNASFVDLLHFRCILCQFCFSLFLFTILVLKCQFSLLLVDVSANSRNSDKQCRPRSDAAFWASGMSLPNIFRTYNIYSKYWDSLTHNHTYSKI